MKKPELLAPAGGREALIAAIENGADAVYFGGAAFSARHYAGNFTREEIEWAIDYAHIRGVRAYVTVNTLIKDSELDRACEYLQFLCNCGADAVIVQDIGLLSLLREELRELPVHASTQMTIHNVEGVKFLQEMGVKRVVLARELSLQEINRIKSQTGMEIEVFIHGALCFSYSGQCLLSSMIGGRSGNRGYCAQPCRKKYRMDGLEGYLLSPKDLNMSEHTGALIEAGIDSFKIEGRMKRPEYVAGVVRVYRKLIDRYFKRPSDFHVREDEKHTLLQLFNRDFTTGYFVGNPGGELMSRKYPHNRGTELGKVLDYEPQKKIVSIFLKAPLRTGDGIGIGGREAGVTVRDIFVHDRWTKAANPGSIVKVFLENEAKKDDMVFKTFDSLLMASLELKNLKKNPVKISFKARTGESAELHINDGENDISIRGRIVTGARNRPVTRESITEQLQKLGTTVFEVKEIIFEMDDDVFIPVSELNSMRREAVSQLEKRRMQRWKRSCKLPEKRPEKIILGIEPILSVNTASVECFEAAVDSGADIVYIGGELFDDALGKEDYIHAIEYGRKKGAGAFINTPRIIKEITDRFTDIEPDGFLVSNPGMLYSLRKTGKPIVIDFPFNVFNRLSMDWLLRFSRRVTLSPELTLNEISSLARSGPAECIVHGYFPLMVSEHGLVKGLFPEGRKEDVFLKDEKGFVFPLKTDAENRTYIMNSRELCLIEYVPDIIKSGVNCMRIEAKTFDAGKTKEVTRAYRKAIDDSSSGKRYAMPIEGDYTTGHYFRGVI